MDKLNFRIFNTKNQNCQKNTNTKITPNTKITRLCDVTFITIDGTTGTTKLIKATKKINIKATLVNGKTLFMSFADGYKYDFTPPNDLNIALIPSIYIDTGPFLTYFNKQIDKLDMGYMSFDTGIKDINDKIVINYIPLLRANSHNTSISATSTVFGKDIKDINISSFLLQLTLKD